MLLIVESMSNDLQAQSRRPNSWLRILRIGPDIHVIRRDPLYDAWAEDAARRAATDPAFFPFQGILFAPPPSDTITRSTLF